MTPDYLAAIGRRLYGDEWQMPLADALGVADRTVRRWAAGSSPVPASVAAALAAAIEAWRLIIPDGVRLTEGRDDVGRDATAIVRLALERLGVDVRVVAVSGSDPARRACGGTPEMKEPRRPEPTGPRSGRKRPAAHTADPAD